MYDFIAKHKDGNYSHSEKGFEGKDISEGTLTKMSQVDKSGLAMARTQEEINKILSKYIK